VAHVAIPLCHQSTHIARAALPGAARHPVAAGIRGRGVRLFDGLSTGHAEALAAAAGDELHELPRRDLSPVTHDLIAVAVGAGARHASWSGAGPTAIAFTTRDTEGAVRRAMQEVLGDAGGVETLAIAEEGWR
jgi:homoserine kinase